MKLSRCDIGESLIAFNEYSEMEFKEGSCYCNAFKLMTQYVAQTKPVSGVIGYVLSTDGVKKVAVRHSWVRNEETGQAIDVSALAAGYSPVSMLNFDYAEVMVMSPMEWLEKTESNDGMPYVRETPEELAYVEELKEQGYEVKD